MHLSLDKSKRNIAAKSCWLDFYFIVKIIRRYKKKQLHLEKALDLTMCIIPTNYYYSQVEKLAEPGKGQQKSK